MSKIKVIQAVNTSDYDQIDGLSCIKYWENNTPYRQESVRYCRATLHYATETDSLVGAHVIGIVDGQPHVYITPILSSVNTSNDPESFMVDTKDLVRIPLKDEQAILLDRANKMRILKLTHQKLV